MRYLRSQCAIRGGQNRNSACCILLFEFCYLFIAPRFAQAAGGACPSGATYGLSANQTLANLGVTSCYYIAANGSDSNDGLSEAPGHPWLHAPQMPNCTSNCLTVQNATLPAGTGLIFRGGDTWHFGNSGAAPYTGGTWNFNTGQTPMGTITHPIYVGVDPTWYTGGAWARPVFTADNPLCNAGTVGANCISTTDSYGQPEFYVNSCAYQIGNTNDFFELSALQYYIIDNFEMLGLCQSDTGQPGHHDVFVSYGSLRNSMTFQNLYMHGWSHLKFAGLNGGPACTPSTVCVNIFAFNGSVIGGGPGEIVRQVVVDGSDSDGAGAGLCFGGFYDVSNSVFRYTSQCIPNPLHTFHDNLYEYFFENGHSNVLESLNDSPGANAVYNNVFRHIETDVTSGGGVGLWLTPHPGTTDFIFNNLMYDVGNMEYINIGSYGQNFGNETYFNNTFQTNPNQTIFNCEYLIGGALTDTNNHFIDDGTQYLGPCNTKTTTTPLLMSNATATTDGYTASETYAYSPIAANSPTVGAGTNESSAYCGALGTAGLTDAQTACESDTQYACTYNTSNHTVACPARSPNTRPASGAWDIGAYEFTSGSGGPPVINGFSANPTTITLGGSSTLSWSVTNATSAAISPGIGPVNPSGGSVLVTPNQTITYTLTAWGTGGLIHANATVTVNNLQTVAMPTISPDGGTFQSPVTVSLEDTTPGAQIYYTLDGSIPTQGSILYIAPFTLNTSVVVSAIGFESGFNPSAEAQASFTISSSTGSGNGPSMPTLNLPQFLPIDATITAGYTGSDPASGFQWTFTPQTQGAQYSVPSSQSQPGTGHQALGTASGAPSASFKTSTPSASLGSVVLGLGPYLVAVQAIDSNNNVSAPAQSYTTLVASDLSGIRVFPNPWRSDRHSGQPITFDHLTVNTTIKIFTVSGHWVKTLPVSSSSVSWDLTNDSGDRVASGIYLYLITADGGQKLTGKLAIIR